MWDVRKPIANLQDKGNKQEKVLETTETMLDFMLTVLVFVLPQQLSYTSPSVNLDIDSSVTNY